MIRVIAFLAVFLATALPASADLQLPALTGRIVDLADVLSSETEAALTEQLAEHEQRTSNQVVVATVPSLQGYDIERFANGLFRAWGLGQKDRNNGVLLLVAPNERAVRIEVGYGLEGTLTDALSADIIQNRILPEFRDGDLDAGISRGVHSILAVSEGTYQPLSRAPSGDTRDALIIVLVILGLFVSMALLALLGNRRRYWVPGWKMPRSLIGGSGFGGGWTGISNSGGFSGGGGSSGGGGASGHW